MKKLRAFFLLWLLPSAPLFSQPAPAEPAWEILAASAAGEFDTDLVTGITTATNGVVIKYGDALLTARQVTLNRNSGAAFAEGDVRVQRAGQVWSGETLHYNFKTRQITGENFRMGQGTYFATGQGLFTDLSNRTYVATNGYFSTDDYAEPAQRIRTRHLTIVPGEYIEAHHATLYLGNTPVLYFPKYRRNLKQHRNFFVLTPGYRSLYGPYLLGSYHHYWNQQFETVLNLDYRERRGVGTGPEINYDAGRFGLGTFRYYYLRDEEPDIDPNVPRAPDNRQRIYFTHAATLRTNLTVKAVARWQDDATIVRDFFEDEYRRNVQPDSFLEVNQSWQNFSLDVLAQPRLNRFFETVERLPDVKLTGLRQQLGATPLYYESDSSAGYFRHKFPGNSTTNFAAWRADTHHQLLLPHTFFGWLNFTPRAGGRFTHYGEAEGSGSATAEQSRSVFNTGAEVSFKASRLWQGARSRFFEVEGLRHIVEPSFNYVYVPSPNKLPPQLPQFDSELPSFRLLPIDYPDYNAIDSVDSQNVLRLGLRNRVQTKRRGEIDNLVNWAFYTDWRIRPRSGQSTFADIFSDLDFRPRSWLTLTSESRYDVANERWRLANHVLTLQPSNTWSISLGHYYLRDDPLFGLGYNLIISRFYYRFNENWAGRVAHHFEARDGTMEEQQYTLYRDLRSWTAAITFRVRENRLGGPTDYAVAFTISLKAFPRFKLNQDRDQPSLLLGG